MYNNTHVKDKTHSGHPSTSSKQLDSSLISVIVPCFATTENNHGSLVGRAVASALRQSVNKEIIIVDDGSPLPVHNVWGDPIRVIRHEVNRGLSEALNTGIRNSNGDRFIIVSSDDELRYDCLEKMSQYDADVVCSDFRGDQGPPIKCKPADLHTLVNAGNCHSYAALTKKSFWERVGGYKSTMNPSWEDMEFWVSLASVGASWAYVPEALHLYHRSTNGRDADAQTKERLLKGKLHGYHQDLFGKGKGLVTFVIPCYNQEHWLPEALASIKAQIYPHVNVVVVDDGSPGNVLKAINVGGVHLIRQHNKHLSGARNTGIRYALDNFHSEYLCMLDADDTVESTFIEECMIHMTGNHEYIYTDIEFIGDAWHRYILKEYDCKLLTKRHIHPCTFLAQSAMFQDVIRQRGYCYDENMKKGYEDWEFALAAMHAGWCGKRYPKPLFHYRYHNGGSMRMEAGEINNELATYIKNKHIWINNQGAIDMACASCGGNRVYTKRVVNKNGGFTTMLNVPGVGQVDGREPLQVTYNGSTTSIITKIGSGGHIYKYSAVEHQMIGGQVIGPVFTAFAADAHMFVGPFNVTRLNVPQPAAPQLSPTLSNVMVSPSLKPVEIPREPTEAERLNAKFTEREKKLVTVTALEPDDFTVLKYVAESGAKKLQDAGFAYFEDIADASPDEIALVLKPFVTKNKAEEIIAQAKSNIKQAA